MFVNDDTSILIESKSNNSFVLEIYNQESKKLYLRGDLTTTSST